MKPYLDVMERAVELSASCVEALEHIAVRLSEGGFEDTIPLMNDFVTGVYQIEQSIQGLIAELPEEATNQLKSAMEQTVSAYEQGDLDKALEAVQAQLLPSCKAWKLELDKALHAISV